MSRSSSFAVAVMASFTLTAASCEAPRPHARIVAAPDAGDVASAVKAQLELSAKAKRSVLVMVGAPWCEPCVALHHAAERGELDDVIGDTDLLVFDFDKDGERLAAAGYGATYVPLVVVPGVDGRGTEQRMEGAIKGQSVADGMKRRLAALRPPGRTN